MRCKCRYCQINLDTKDACLQMIDKKRAYFCNEEHYDLLLKKIEQEEIAKQKRKEEEAAERQRKREEEVDKQKRKREEAAAERQRKREEEAKAVEIRKQHKDKAYYLICDIIGRKEIINTLLWAEWKIWNKVADNERIGQYLEENKEYLISVIARLKNDELQRIRYLSAILKNNLGDFKIMETLSESKKQSVKVDDTFYEPIQTKNNKRRSLADLEDEF